jgi:uncharacterized membrane protein YhdT
MNADLQEESEVLSNWQLAAAFLNPRQGFAQLQGSPRFALPLLVLLIGTALEIHWYFSIVDFDWFKQQLVDAIRGPGAGEHSQALLFASRTTLELVSLISAELSKAITLLVYTVYLYLAGAALGIHYPFDKWFAFSCWTSVALTVGIISGMLLLLFEDVSSLGIGALQPLSLNELFFDLDPATSGAGLLSNLTLPGFAQAALATIGFKVWSGRSLGFATAVVVIPQVIVYGIWALIAFL